MTISSNSHGTPFAANFDTHRECGVIIPPMSLEILDNDEHAIFVASSSGARLHLPEDSMVQYSEIDTRNAQVS